MEKALQWWKFCVLTDGFLCVCVCVSSVVCANGCIAMVGACVCISGSLPSFGMCVCVFLPVNVAWACRSDTHVLTQGLCPCFPVNTLFFSSAADEGQIGGLLFLHLLLLFFSPSVFFSLRLVLKPSLSPPDPPL